MKVDLKNKKHLIVSGCSFTDGFWLEEKGSWAYYLSDMLDLKLHNKARGGMGNEYICDSIISYLLCNEDIQKDCVVGIAWSETTRLTNPVPLPENEEVRLIDTVRPFDFEKGAKYHKYKGAEQFFSDLPWCAYRTYMSIIKLTSFLESKNIPFFCLNSINPIKLIFSKTKDNHFHFDHNTNESPDKLLLEFDLAKYWHNLKDILNENINSKIFNEFLNIGDSVSIQDYLWKNDGNDYDKLTKNNGGHPNEIASKEIAEIIYKQII